jgi:FkbM family methyltransferase
MITLQDVYGAFVGAVPLNFRIMREICQVSEIEFQPRDATPLHVPAVRYDSGAIGPATCRLQLDYVIAPEVLTNHAWDSPALEFYRTLIPTELAAFTLVDIGANVGLISRELMIAFPQIRRAFAYEPHPGNFRCLTHNLRAFRDTVEAANCAVGAENASLALYLDVTNSGNYSLNRAAVVDVNLAPAVTVPVRRAADEAAAWRRAGLPIFYKSDTQGHDEVIATSLDLDFWDQVFIGTMEIWRISKPVCPPEKLRAALDRFPNKVFRHQPQQPVTTEPVLAFARGDDRVFQDLVFWR